MRLLFAHPTLRLVPSISEQKSDSLYCYSLARSSTTNSTSLSKVNLQAELLSASNYYAFGMLMPGRSYQPESHRFGFNGQEKDDEINGSGNLNTAMYWEYDTRLGRRWNIDPKPSVSLSNYNCFADNPIWYSDVLGDKLSGTTKEDAQNSVKEMKNIFGPNSAIFSKYFTIGSDKQTFNKIENVRDFNKWLNGKGEYKGHGSGFSKEQIALANGFMKEINSGFDLKISFSPGISEFKGESKYEGTSYIGSDAATGDFCDTRGNNRQYTQTQTFVHEVLGEGYTAMMSGDMKAYWDRGTTIPSARTKTMIRLIHSEDLKVIQIENIFNQLNGFLRSGTIGNSGSHGLDYKDIPNVGLIPANLGSSFYIIGDWIWQSKK